MAKSKTGILNNVNANTIAFTRRMIVQNFNGVASKDTNRMTSYVEHFSNELYNMGFLVTSEIKDYLITTNVEFIQSLYSDLMGVAQTVLGTGGYEPIYKNFPASVQDMSLLEFRLNAIRYYWTGQMPNDESFDTKELTMELGKLKELKLATIEQFCNIGNTLMAVTSSINQTDKAVLGWFVENYPSMIDVSKVRFKENLAIILGDLYYSKGIATNTPMSATDVLRAWTHVSGGDVSLASNTKFTKPNNRQIRAMMGDLNISYDLAESMKMYINRFLKLVFYFNPLTTKNRKRYPNLANTTELIRNNSKAIRTFNSKLQKLIDAKDVKAFKLLKKRAGLFARKLNEMHSKFGLKTFDHFLEVVDKVPMYLLVDIYNYYNNRRTDWEKRVAVLKSEKATKVKTYKGLTGLGDFVVDNIQTKLLEAIESCIRANFDAIPMVKVETDETDKKGKTIMSETEEVVFIDPVLYDVEIEKNVRASSGKIQGLSMPKGSFLDLPKSNIARFYCYWSYSGTVGGSNRVDIDLSGMVKYTDGRCQKIGWNGCIGNGIVTYSGDNVGNSSRKCAEYIDIDLNLLRKSNIDTIIICANSYTRQFFSNMDECLMGVMELDNPIKASLSWLPKSVTNAVNVQSETKTTNLFAIHVPSLKWAFLDTNTGDDQIATSQSAELVLNTLAKTFENLTRTQEVFEPTWSRINIGQLLELHYKNRGAIVTRNEDEATKVFDLDNYSYDEISGNFL